MNTLCDSEKTKVIEEKDVHVVLHNTQHALIKWNTETCLHGHLGSQRASAKVTAQHNSCITIIFHLIMPTKQWTFLEVGDRLIFVLTLLHVTLDSPLSLL